MLIGHGNGGALTHYNCCLVCFATRPLSECASACAVDLHITDTLQPAFVYPRVRFKQHIERSSDDTAIL